MIESCVTQVAVVLPVMLFGFASLFGQRIEAVCAPPFRVFTSPQQPFVLLQIGAQLSFLKQILIPLSEVTEYRANGWNLPHRP